MICHEHGLWISARCQLSGSSEEERVNLELVRQVLRNSPIGIAATIVNASILVLVLWKTISHPVLFIWFMTTICLVLLRLIFLYKYPPATLSPDQYRVVTRLFVIGVGLSGIAWGCTALFLFPVESPTHQILVMFVLCGMVAGGAVAFSSLMTVFLAFTLSILVPLIIRFLVIGGAVYYAMSAMTLLYIVLTTMIARRINLTTRELIRLKEFFAQMVKERTSELSRANEELRLQAEQTRRAEEARRQLEKQLQQTHRMEAISTLAGGIAHQFNNALFVINGSLDLLNMVQRTDPQVTKYFERIRDSAQRMAKLTSHLVASAWGGKHQLQKIPLSDFVQETLPLLEHTIDPGITIETDLRDDVLSVEGDPLQLQMLISVLVANATESMEGSGTIRVSTANREVDESLAAQHPGLKPGQYVCLTIEDSGKGMDEETIARIFEPFFSTKFHGRGLGMATAYRIVQSHNGWIEVDSQLGEGTVVRVYLPSVSVTSR